MYLLEGNMGVGKSTFLKLIQKYIPEALIHFEPSEHWIKEGGILGEYFKNPSRWEYTTSTYIMFCRVRDYVEVQKNRNPNIIMERSIYSGHFCYARSGYSAGNYTPAEWRLYNDIAQLMIRDKCRPPLGFIYLKASPETCFERVQKRNEASEKDTPFSFVQEIGKWHDKFLIEKEDLFPEVKNIPVLVLDAEKDFINNKKVVQDYIDKVWLFMKKTQIVPSRRARSLPQSWLFQDLKHQSF